MLVSFGQVDTGFFSRISRSQQLHVLEFPQASETSIRPIGGREKYVGIEEEPVNGHEREGLRGL